MPKSDDIRLQPECLAALEKACGFSKADYAEAFTNGGNFRTEVWEGRRILLNPPWHLKNRYEMAEKLRTDRPSHFVAIVNKSATGNMTNLMAAAGLDPIALTPTTAGGFFERHTPSRPIERLHAPAFWQPVAYVGTAADLARGHNALEEQEKIDRLRHLAGIRSSARLVST